MFGFICNTLLLLQSGISWIAPLPSIINFSWCHQPDANAPSYTARLSRRKGARTARAMAGLCAAAVRPCSIIS